jgi:tetratricopeptide (TPR) repeat protein
MKRLTPRVFLLLAALTAALASLPVHAERGEAVGWSSVRTRNFTVVGEAREKDLRRVATRLEEYRAALSRLLPEGPTDASAPTTVIVFRDDNTYRPFKPIMGGQTANYVAGYFQPGSEVNYITLALDSDWSRGPASTLLHEYTHLLVNNYFRAAPLWLKEGLAEFYSTARVSGDRRRVTTGAQLPGRVRQLRGATELIPLRTLFDVDQQSPYYYESGKRGLFYAQSWALAHFILNGEGGSRRARLPRFVELLASGVAPADAFGQAFGLDLDAADAALASYVRLGVYSEASETFARPLDFDSQLRAEPLPEAEGLALLGDLLLHTERVEESEGYLARAIALDPKLARARVSLGLLRLRQNRPDDAREQLSLAARTDPRNHLAHYLLAEALNHGAGESDAAKLTVKDFEERTELMRAELRKAIELAPDFPEPYRLLATIEMERADRPDEAIGLLRRASALAPRRQDLVLLLAQAYLFKGAFDEARRLAEPVAMHAAEQRMREQAAAFLVRVNAREESDARRRSQADETERLEEAADAASPVQPCDMPRRGGPQYKRLRFEGEQTCGRLVAIECDDAGVTLSVESGDKTLRLHADDLRSVRFVTYTTAVKTGRLTCGPRERAEQVLVTYKPRRDQLRVSDGEALAVEFVPEDWNH